MGKTPAEKNTVCDVFLPRTYFRRVSETNSVHLNRKMGLDETDTDLCGESPDEIVTNERAHGDHNPEGIQSTPGTPQERPGDDSVELDPPSSTRESFFSSDIVSTAGGMPEISIRRRTRVAGAQGDNTSGSSAVPSAGIHQGGAIAQASRIIPELELEHGSMIFPLDSLRGDANFDDVGEDSSG